mmetsp:Transcript_2338/g.6458  ORF Transcript_2338/g.6458 Transcript_2338/m.6458 type:complete len:199 (+) Transcript_2338:285-881(+)
MAQAMAQNDDEMFEVMEAPPSAGFDMFQDRPTSTGVRKKRALVHRDRDWHRSVHIWLVDVEKQLVVLQKRSMQKDTYPGRWDISAAGHIETNDDSKETACREVQEELGLVIQPHQIDRAFTCPAEQAPIGGCNCFEDVYFLAVQEATCKFELGTAEVDAYCWLPIDELRAAWQRQDEKYVPRVEHYKDAFFRHLDGLR